MSLQFDQSPALYWFIGYGFAFLLALGWWKLPHEKKTWILFIGAVALVLWMRLPILIFNQEIDPDESQMIGHAITLKQDPIYWKYVDAHTIGPLAVYILILPSYLGFPLDYTSGRVIGLLCLMGSLFFFYRSVRKIVGKDAAWIALFPILLFMVFIQEGDFVHYSSEQLALLLLNIALWLHIRQTPTSYTRYWFLIGFLLGILPFCKLQSVPLGLVLGFFSLLKCFQSHRNPWRSVGALIAGGLAFPLAVLAWVFGYGLWDDFWTFYIQGNLVYAGGLGFWENLRNGIRFFKSSPGFTLYCITLLPILVSGFRQWSMTSNLFLAILWVVVAFYSILKTGNIFPHYLNFLLYPLSFLAVVWGQKIIQERGIMISLWICMVWTGLILYTKWNHQPINRYVSTSTAVPISSVSRLILQHATPPDRMTIWGWMGKYHVETQLPQGAAESHTERCIFDHPLKVKYYNRYLKDLQEKQPKVFVDAVGPRSFWVQDRATQGHDAFPELKKWIDTHYQLVGEVDFTRVYVRK